MLSKGFAIFIRVIGCLVAAIQIVAILHTAEHSYDPNTWAILTSLALAALNLVLAFSYAKLIDTTRAHTEDIRWVIDEDIRSVKESLENQISFMQKQISFMQKQVSAQPIPDPELPGYVTCPCCGMRQKDNQVCCLDCGVPFATK